MFEKNTFFLLFLDRILFVHKVIWGQKNDLLSQTYGRIEDVAGTYLILSALADLNLEKGTNISAVFQTQEDQSPVKTLDDVPPPPPTRVTSLPEYHRSNAVEASSDEDDGDDVDDIDEELAALIDDDDERPPELPPKKGTPTDFDSVFSQQDEDDEERWVCHRRTG